MNFSPPFKYFNDFLELFFPRICMVCGSTLLNQEKLICLQCLHELPRTNFHLEERNPVAEIFYGRVRLEAATSFFFFNKGSKYQKLIHALKYKGIKDIGTLLGHHLALELKKSDLYASVDIVCPVPLHPKKEKIRGYNQSEYIARGLADCLKKPLSEKNLVRLIHTNSQTHKNRYERWENVEGIFKLMFPDEFKEKHILLVDDVLTTGSTLEACASVILSAVPEVKVSVATLGFA